VEDARVDQVVMLDTSNAAQPVQLESIGVGVHTSHSAGAPSGDGAWLFVVNGIDGTVSQIDVAARQVVRTFDVGASPRVVATFGTDEGPSEVTGPITGE
jgi:YVTN family beta-propeller protein